VAFLLLVFFTEMPVEHWALGCISVYGNGFHCLTNWMPDKEWSNDNSIAKIEDPIAA
jgi:hypothetical protein